MSRRLARCCGLFLLLVLLVACQARPAERPGNDSLDEPVTPATSSNASANILPGTGDEAYDFTLEQLSGGSVTLSDLRGDWVLLNFWATWCPPCVREMPYLDQVARTRDLHVLGVNMNETREVVEEFVAETAITFPILLEPDETVKIMYEARALPRTVIVAPDGTLAGVAYGAVSEEGLERWLDEHDVPRR